MSIDLSTATVSKGGEKKPVYEGGIDLSTAYISSSTIGSRKGLLRDEMFQEVLNKPIQIASGIDMESGKINFDNQSENLMNVLSDVRRKARLEKPDVPMQVLRSLGRFGVGVVKSAASIAGAFTEDRYKEVIEHQAKQIEEKRKSPNYVKWLDLGYWADSLTLATAAKLKPVKIGDEVIQDKGFFDKVNTELDRFIENDLFVKPGTVNEWTDKITSAFGSIGLAYTGFGIARALQASVAVQALTPATIIGAMAGGQALEMGKIAGVDYDTRLRAGVEVAIAEGAIEAIGFNFVIKYLKGGQPVVRILSDMANNAFQELFQGITEGAILKMEGISQQDWKEIWRDSVEDAVVGLFVSSPFSVMAYHAQNKSLIGDFRKRGFSDAQVDKALEAVFSTESEKIQVKGDFANVLMQKGFTEQEAKNAEDVIEDYGGKIELATALKESPGGKIISQLIQRGFSPAVALELSEHFFEQMRESTIKVLAEDMQNMQEEIATENAHTKIRLAFMQIWVGLGKPEGRDQIDWIEEGLALSDIIAMKTIADAKRRNIDPVELYKSESPVIKRAGSLAEIQSFPRSNLEFLTEDEEREIENRLRESSIDFENKKAILKGINGNVVVAPSAKEKGKWQATFVNKEGIPSGDVVRDTFEQALKEGMSDVGIPEYKLFDEKGNYLFQQKINLTPEEQENEFFKQVKQKLSNTLFQSGVSGPTVSPLGFYSQAEQAILDLKQEKMTGEQLIKMLEKAGVKKEELEWTGLAELGLKDKVTKQEALDTWRENQVQVEVKDKKEKVHSIEITEKMKESIPKGLPLFQRGVPQQPRAMIDMNEEQGKRTIYLFKNADKTSLIHELAHDWVKRMFDYIKSGNADMETIKHYATLQEWLGIEEGQSDLTVEQQERFASGLERVLGEGDLSVGSEVASAFRAFRDWVRAVYVQTGLPGEELSPEVKDFFSWFLGLDQNIDEVIDDTIKSYDDIQYMTEEEFKGHFDMEEDDVYAVLEAEMARHQLGLWRKLLKDWSHRFGADLFRDRAPEEQVAMRRFINPKLKKGTFKTPEAGVDGWLEEIIFDHNEILGIPSAEGLLVEDLKSWMLDNLHPKKLSQTIYDLRNKIELGKSIERAYAKEKRIAMKHLAKSMRKQKRLKAISDKVVASYKKGFARGLREGTRAGRIEGIEKATMKFKPIIDALKNKAKTVKEAQKEVEAFIKELDIPAKDKAKFLSSIKRVDSLEKLNKEIESIRERAADYYDSNEKNKIQNKINKLLDRTLPKKEGTKVVGRYDYESNTFFETYRNYAKMNKKEAVLQLQSEGLLTLDDVLTEQDKMFRRILQLKANGKNASVQLYASVLADINSAIYYGSLAKNEEDFMRLVERKETVEETLREIERMKGDKDSIKTRIVNLYRAGFTNIYSMLNSIMGKELAKKYDPEYLESQKETAIHFKSKQIIADAAKALGVEVNNLNSELKKMASDKVMVSDIYDRVIELDRLDLIDIYLSIKNPTILERYIKAFGDEQVFELVGKLSDAEKAMGNVLLEAVNEYYPIMNERHIEITGRDLGRVKGVYWPATSEKPVNVYDDVMPASEIYSAMKERGGSNVIPRPANAWLKAMKHIRSGEHIRYLSRKHEELKRLLSDIKVHNLIENKFGADIYQHLMQQLKNISLHKEIERTNAVEGVFGKALNNWVVAKIGVNPSVFVKQLVSIGNYMEDMPVAEWTKYFFEGIANPKETFDFMWNNAPFLEARFNRGYEEAVSRAMEGAVNIGKLKDNWAKALSSLVRAGDITAIIYGGYSVVKYNQAQGKSLKEAVAMFERQTTKAQQSGLASGLSEFQNNRNPFARLFLAFQNTSFQYTRKQIDALISYSNGDMSKLDLAKTLMIYSVIQPALYVFAGNLVREMYILLGKIIRGDSLDDDDDEKKSGWFSGIIEEILTAPFNAIPIINGLIKRAVNGLKGEKAYRAISLPLIDDIEQAVRDMSKKDITFKEWLIAVGSITAELTTGAPIQTATRIGKKLFKEEDKKGVKRANINRAMPTRNMPRRNMPTRNKPTRNVPTRKR